MAANRALDKLIADLDRKYRPAGADKPVISSGIDIDYPVFFPSTSYAINYLLGGGWVEGRLHEIFGPESAGKTTLIMLALQDCWRYYGKTRAVAFFDIEHRFNREWAEKLGIGVDDWFKLVQPPNAEIATDIAQDFVQSKQFCAIAWDSIGGSSTSEEQKTFDDRRAIVGGGASVMSRNVRTLAPMANLFKTTLLYSNQIRADMDGYHRVLTSGGHAVKHAMSVRIYLRRGREKYTDKTPEGDVQVGNSLVFKTVKNTFAPAPREQWSDFYFVPCRYLDHIGYDINKELQRLGLLTGVFTQSSSWYYYQKDTPSEIKGNGRDAFFELIDRSDLKDQIAKEIMASLARGEPVRSDLPELKRPEVDGPEIDDSDV